MHIPSQSFVPADDLDEVSHRVAEVDVDRKIPLPGEVKLPLQRVFLLLDELFAFVVVKSYLSDSHDLTSIFGFPVIEEPHHGVNLGAPFLGDGSGVQPYHRAEFFRMPPDKGEHGFPLRRVDVRLEHQPDSRRPRPRDVGVFLSGKGLVAKVAMCVYEYHGVKDSENKPNYKTL